MRDVDLISLSEAAEYLGVSVRKARRYASRKKNPLPVIVVGKRNRYAIRNKLDEWKQADEERWKRRHKKA